MSRKPDEPHEPDDVLEHSPEGSTRGSSGAVPGAVIDARRPAAVAPASELPVVARLVVEIRSDGRRTIARGALEDLVQGERVAVEARGDSPLSLALGLARSILSMPMLARASARRLLGGLGRGGGGNRGGRGPGDE